MKRGDFRIAVLLGILFWTSVVIAQSVLPQRVSVEILLDGGTPGVTPPIAEQTTSIGATERCNIAPGTPPTTLPATEFNDPFTESRVCQTPVPSGLPLEQNLRATARFLSDLCTDDQGQTITCASDYSMLSDVFRLQDPCPPGSVALIVGDWTRTVSPGALGRVTYNLMLSTTAITTLIVNFNGVEQDRVTGSDLRKVGASYFRVPVARGNYLLTVEAQNAVGCSDGATRPMTVTVQ